MRRAAAIALSAILVLVASAVVLASPARTALSNALQGSPAGASATTTGGGPAPDSNRTWDVTISPPENASGNISVDQSISVNNTAGSVTVNGTTNVTIGNRTVVNVTYPDTANWTTAGDVAFEANITVNGTNVEVSGTVTVNATAGTATVSGTVLVERSGVVLVNESFTGSVTWTGTAGITFDVRTSAGLVLEVTVTPGASTEISVVTP